MILHLNGLPGVGKLTVAREICKLLQARKMRAHLVDNHLIHNIPLALTPRETPEYWALFQKTRDLVYAELTHMPKDAVIIMTNALALGIATNDEQIEKLMNLVAARGDTFKPVLLLCDLAENQQRVVNKDRALNRKLTSPEKIAEYHARIKMWHPEGGLAYDITKATPDYVAQKIVTTLFPLPN